MKQPFTPADFAIGEGRFAKQFRWLAAHEEDGAIPIAEYVELPHAKRAARTPFIYTTDRQEHLVKMACSAGVVAMVEDRRQYWRTLQFLAGQSEALLSVAHKAEIAALDRSVRRGRRGSRVGARRHRPGDGRPGHLQRRTGRQPAPPRHAGDVAPAAPVAHAAPAATATTARPIWLDVEDLPKCNDCATCYQELPQLFEKSTIIVEGEPQTVGRMMP